MKLGLIGGKDIAKYTIADRLWRIIADVIKLDIEFQVIPILNETKLSEFFHDYRNDSEFVGFNVALPWKGHFIELVDHNDFVSDNCKLINTVYKLDNQVRSANTDVLGIVRYHKNIRRFKSVLILGLGGAGFATAEYLITQELVELVYGYDPNQILPANSGFMVVPDYRDLMSRKYDLIINATPHGKYYFDQQPQSFTTPIAPNMLRLISHKATVVQEMNYFPVSTPLLQLADIMSLNAISGTRMLVNQAVASLELYTKQAYSADLIDVVHNLVSESAIELENNLIYN